MKLVQLIADSNGALTYGLDVAGNVWRLKHIGLAIQAASLEVNDIDEAKVGGAPCENCGHTDHDADGLCRDCACGHSCSPRKASR